MPDLPITAEDLGRSRNRLSLLHIAAVMLVPNDHKRRSKLQLACDLEKFIDDLRLSDINLTGAKAAEFVEAVQLLQPVKRVGQGIVLPDDLHLALRHGTIAGQILVEALGFADAEKRVQLKPAIERAKRLINLPRGGSPSTYEKTVWNGFRSVAPLWAASYATSRQNRDFKFFPCRLRDLDSFLATAEALRLRGETVRWRQSNRLVLDPDKTWKVPHGVSLPPSAIKVTV